MRVSDYEASVEGALERLQPPGDLCIWRHLFAIYLSVYGDQAFYAIFPPVRKSTEPDLYSPVLDYSISHFTFVDVYSLRTTDTLFKVKIDSTRSDLILVLSLQHFSAEGPRVLFEDRFNLKSLSSISEVTGAVIDFYKEDERFPCFIVSESSKTVSLNPTF